MSLMNNISDRPRNKKAQANVQRAVEVMSASSNKREVLSFYDKVAGIDRQAVTKSANTWMQDGVDHVNIWVYAKTELGRALDQNYVYPWTHPLAGKFKTVSGFMLAVSMREYFDPRVRQMSDHALHVYAKYQKDQQRTYMIANYEKVLAEAMYYRLRSMEGVKEEMLASKDLPFDCYSVRRDTGETMRPWMNAWYVPAMEIIRSAIIADKTPDFSVFDRPGYEGVKTEDILREHCRQLCNFQQTFKPVEKTKETPAVKKKESTPTKEKKVHETKPKTPTKKQEPIPEAIDSVSKPTPEVTEEKAAKPKVKKEKKVKVKKPIDPEVLAQAQAKCLAGNIRRRDELTAELTPGQVIAHLFYKFASHEERYLAMKAFKKMSKLECKNILLNQKPDFDPNNKYPLHVSIEKKDDQEYMVFSTDEFLNPYIDEKSEPVQIATDSEEDGIKIVADFVGFQANEKVLKAMITRI